MNLQEKPTDNKFSLPRADSMGLYVHVPFCATTCDFCAFYQEKPAKDDYSKFLNAIERELKLTDFDLPLSTIFWGGGTPGLLPLSAMQFIGRHIRDIARDTMLEWTVEMAPSTINPTKLNMLKSLGVNRISMGVQSFNKDVLEKLGREHSPAQVERAYYMIRSAGFENVNLDLMFAMPGQTLEQWEEDLRKAVSLKPEHISTYCLTFEEDTAMWVKLQQGQFKLCTETERALYQRAWEFLESEGYGQYEVSNFSKPGFECLHNINTWGMQEWVGVGPSAASQYKGRRYSNVASIDEWYDGLMNGVPKLNDCITLDQETLAIDSLIFGLRKNEGVDLNELKTRFPDWPLDEVLGPVFSKMVSENYITYEDNRVQLTAEGRFLADAIGAELLESVETVSA